MFTHEQRRDDRLYKKKCFLECRDYDNFVYLQKLRDTQEGEDQIERKIHRKEKICARCVCV